MSTREYKERIATLEAVCDWTEFHLKQYLKKVHDLQEAKLEEFVGVYHEFFRQIMKMEAMEERGGDYVHVQMRAIKFFDKVRTGKWQ